MRLELLAALGVVGCHTAPGGVATVTVHGETARGVTVYFQDADSGLLARVVTDDRGVAAGTIRAGGFVTVVDPFGHDEVAGAQVYTWVDVQPDDQLVLRPPPPPSDPSLPPPTTMTTITYPASINPLVTRYQVFAAGCSVGTYPASIAGGVVTQPLDLHRCDTTVDLLVMAFDDASAHVEWGYAGDVAVTSAIDLGGLTWSPYATQTLTFDNVPPALNAPLASTGMQTSRGAIFGTTIEVGPTTALLPLIPGALNAIEFHLSDLTTFHVLDVAPFVPEVRMDVGARLVAAATSCPVYVYASRTLSWTEDATPGRAPVDFAASQIDVKPHDGAAWTWRILGPSDGATLVLPGLPEDVAPPLERIDFYSVRGLVRGSVAGGYAALVASGVWSFAYDSGYQRPLSVLGSVSMAHTGACMPL